MKQRSSALSSFDRHRRIDDGSEVLDQEWLPKYGRVAEQLRPTLRPIATDKYEGQASRRNDCRYGTDVGARYIDVEDGQIE